MVSDYSFVYFEFLFIILCKHVRVWLSFRFSSVFSYINFLVKNTYIFINIETTLEYISFYYMCCF